jgi:hypothetical protein
MSDAGAGNQTNSSAADLSDQAFAAGQQAKDAAAGFAQSATETIKRQASDAAEAAKSIASEAGDKLQNEAMGRKNQAADYVDRVADAMRRAASEFEPDLPIAASYIRSAASQVESVSASVRDGDLRDLLQGAQSFARSQPTAFLGLAALGGFALVRFLRSSARQSQNSQSDMPAAIDYH